jgi:signal transduction histidine kinase
MSSLRNEDMDITILAPFGRDAALIGGVLRESGLSVRVAESPADLIASVPEHAAAAVIAEEALSDLQIAELGSKLEAQPTWSDFPLIVLTGSGMSTAATELAVRARAPLKNVSLLERPLRPATLISSARTALAARRRQYELRNYLRERKLNEEALRSARDALESIVEERTCALRRLSAQLLRVQDEERRRIARELHDSLGQYLAAAKINLDTLVFNSPNGDTCFHDLQQLIDRCISETRTLSHLLHPPLLDLTGFSSAATWYVEGYAKRSGIKASLKLPEKLGRLPIGVETALFRIMQEALTNVHRHSVSRAVDIVLGIEDSVALLIIRDFGQGIPSDVLEQFTQSGTNVGVGLAGIRERVRELGGSFEIQSNRRGTVLQASIPFTEQEKNAYEELPVSHIYSSLAN